jgi:dihydrofolate reductase
MRKVLVFTNISLDGYFEGPGHDLSAFSHDFEAFPSKPGEEVDALLFGRKTYEMMKFWATPQAREMAPAVASFINATQKFVASRLPFDAGWQGVQVLSGDVAGAVRELKSAPGKNILIMGSNTLVVSLLQAGLIDELQIQVNPVALGAGTALFEGLSGRLDFRLLGTQAFKSGAVMLRLLPITT